MRSFKFFLFFIMCFFSYCVVFASDDVIIKSITPVYDDSSGVIVTNDKDNYGVMFNDKNQSITYNVVIENTSKNDLKVKNIKLPSKSEEFLQYTLDGIDENDILKANETKEILLSLETVPMTGWGRNFKDELSFDVSFVNEIINTTSTINPNTNTSDLKTLLVFSCILTGIILVVYKKNKVAIYVVLLLTLSSTLLIVKAQELFVLSIKVNASYESQNVMSKSYEMLYDQYDDQYYPSGIYFWNYKYCRNIKIVNIQNELNEIADYVYKFDVSEKQNGKVIAYLVENKEDYNYYDLYLQADGIIYPNADASYYFADMYYLETINNLEGLDTSNVINMDTMFRNVGVYSSKLSIDFSNFDTSNVTTMREMFGCYCSSCDEVSLDLSDFDTRNVVDMSSMFWNFGRSSKKVILKLNGIDTSKVTDMSNMFGYAGYESEVLELYVDELDISNVTDLSHMFSSTGVNTTRFVLDVSKFDTSSVTDMSGMFWGTGKNNPDFDIDVSKFDTSKVTNMSYMFHEFGYKKPNLVLDLSNFDTSNVINMNGMFSDVGYNSQKISLNISSFDTSKVTDMSWMFSSTGYNSKSFSLNLDNFDTSSVTDMSGMFSNIAYNNPNFDLDLEHFDTGKVKNMNYMFSFAAHSSSSFNCTISITNKNVTTYDGVFSSAAYSYGAKLIVNYTSETSDLVDKMIATKSPNSNVVKGVLVE